MLSSALFTLAGQIMAGAAAYAVGAGLVSLASPTRRRLLSWTTSVRSLRVAAVCSAGTLLLVLVWSTDASRDIPWTVVAAGALPAASCWVLLDAGRLETRGKRTRARLQARLGGLLLGTGVLPQVGLTLLQGRDFEGSPALYYASLLALGASGWIGLVGGLAGKPRPSSWFAAALYLAGVLGLLEALRGT